VPVISSIRRTSVTSLQDHKAKHDLAR